LVSIYFFSSPFCAFHHFFILFIYSTCYFVILLFLLSFQNFDPISKINIQLFTNIFFIESQFYLKSCYVSCTITLVLMFVSWCHAVIFWIFFFSSFISFLFVPTLSLHLHLLFLFLSSALCILSFAHCHVEQTNECIFLLVVQNKWSPLKHKLM